MFRRDCIYLAQSRPCPNLVHSVVANSDQLQPWQLAADDQLQLAPTVRLALKLATIGTVAAAPFRNSCQNFSCYSFFLVLYFRVCTRKWQYAIRSKGTHVDKIRSTDIQYCKFIHSKFNGSVRRRGPDMLILIEVLDRHTDQYVTDIVFLPLSTEKLHNPFLVTFNITKQ